MPDEPCPRKQQRQWEAKKFKYEFNSWGGDRIRGQGPFPCFSLQGLGFLSLSFPELVGFSVVSAFVGFLAAGRPVFECSAAPP